MPSIYDGPWELDGNGVPVCHSGCRHLDRHCSLDNDRFHCCEAGVDATVGEVCYLWALDTVAEDAQMLREDLLFGDRK